MQTKDSINILGMDPSLRNWGLSCGRYDLNTGKISIETLHVIQPVLSTGKQVRQNSLDLESAMKLCETAMLYAKDAHAIFVEVPQGSQSARAATGYGICVGVLGALRATGIPFFEVTPTEVKLASFGKKTATKKDMIAWATSKHPEANWPYYKKHGVQLITEDKAEHMADATAAIYAGLACNSFKQMLPFLRMKHAA